MLRKTISGKEYTFEFGIEATLYNDVTESIMNTFVTAGIAQNEATGGNVKDAMKTIVQSMSDIPQRAITLFYAGLLEHHGPSGDGSVKSINDAKTIMVQYMKENGISMYEIMSEMTELMASDNFFEMIGLDKMLENMNQAEEKPRRGRKKASVGEN